jgi:D-serine deaminase-like pyridoxal phosphate-dependent protein
MLTSSTRPTNRKNLPLVEVDTPALLLDAAALKANIDRMAAFFANRPCGLRPHFKSHKCTRIAQLQLQAGAVGITCAKLGEAEVLADAGIREILIANQIVGRTKIARLVELAKRAAPMVAVDSEENVRMLSKFAATAQVEIRVLVEVNIGLNRCGVQAGAPALALARLIVSLPGIKFEGLQGYEGHLVDLRSETERAEKTRAALGPLVETRRLIESAGIPVNIVTGGGTGTYTMTGDFPGVDEVQAGSYAAMDWYYSDIRPEFQQAMSILATVISRPTPEKAVIDVGRKGIGGEFGPPRVKSIPGASVSSFGSEEHTSISLPPGSRVAVGDQLEIIPSHGCTTSNLYREFLVYRNGVVEDVWPIEGSGQLR